MVSALSHRTLTPVPASRGEGQVHAADLQRAGVGGAQLDKEHGWVRAGARDLAGVHVVSVRAKANAGHRDGIEKRPIRREGGFGIEAWGVGATHRVHFNELMRHAGVTDQ